MNIKLILFLNYSNIEIRNYRLPEIRQISVDGYDHTTNTIYEFLGDYYHGNPNLYKSNEYNKINHKTKKTKKGEKLC